MRAICTLTFPAEDWEDSWKREKVQESREKSGKGLEPLRRKEGGNRRGMQNRIKVRLGPDTTRDATPLLPRDFTGKLPYMGGGFLKATSFLYQKPLNES